MTSHFQRRDIIISGFLCGLPGNPNNVIELKARIGAIPREVWVGYFRRRNERPLAALSEVLPWLTEIKTQRWAINRNSAGQWIVAGNPRFQFGEAVVLTYIGDIDRTFTWQTGPDIEDGIEDDFFHAPIHFEFDEESDYIPIYIQLSEDMVSDVGGEIGLFINDVCYGAEVIIGDFIQLNAYILDVDTDNAVVEFRYHEYGSRSSDLNITEYHVLDQTRGVFRTDNLDLNQKSKFYQVSFRDDDLLINNIVHVTRLEGNYPNPFNPSTTIAFSIAETGNVNIQIYNVRGQLVKNLLNEDMVAGRHTAVWNGDDRYGNSVSSGIYFYRLQSGNSSEIKRMLLLK
jgi:hypothetical protein